MCGRVESRLTSLVVVARLFMPIIESRVFMRRCAGTDDLIYQFQVNKCEEKQEVSMDRDGGGSITAGSMFGKGNIFVNDLDGYSSSYINFKRSGRY